MRTANRLTSKSNRHACDMLRVEVDSWLAGGLDPVAFTSAVHTVMQALSEADPADKADVYSRLGVTLTYHPNEKRVAAEARPASIMYIGACPRVDCTRIPTRFDDGIRA
jgi:hypothetical protein